MHNPESFLENESYKILKDFEIKMDYLFLARRPRPRDSQQKKRIYWSVDFPIPVDHRVKLKESEKKDKYLVRE